MTANPDGVRLLALADELERLQKIADATPDGEPDGYSETQAMFDEHVQDNLPIILAALRAAPVPQRDAEPLYIQCPVCEAGAYGCVRCLGVGFIAAAPSRLDAGSVEALEARCQEFLLNDNKKARAVVIAAREFADFVLKEIALAAPPTLPAGEKVRRATIEECAKLCDGLRREDYSSENADWTAGTLDCATAIRALSTSSNGKPATENEG